MPKVKRGSDPDSGRRLRTREGINPLKAGARRKLRCMQGSRRREQRQEGMLQRQRWATRAREHPWRPPEPQGRYRGDTRKERWRRTSSKPCESAWAARKPAVVNRRYLDSTFSSGEGAKSLREAFERSDLELAPRRSGRTGLILGSSEGQRIPGESSKHRPIGRCRGRSEDAEDPGREVEDRGRLDEDQRNP